MSWKGTQLLLLVHLFISTTLFECYEVKLHSGQKNKWWSSFKVSRQSLVPSFEIMLIAVIFLAAGGESHVGRIIILAKDWASELKLSTSVTTVLIYSKWKLVHGVWSEGHQGKRVTSLSFDAWCYTQHITLCVFIYLIIFFRARLCQCGSAVLRVLTRLECCYYCGYN